MTDSPTSAEVRTLGGGAGSSSIPAAWVTTASTTAPMNSTTSGARRDGRRSHHPHRARHDRGEPVERGVVQQRGLPLHGHLRGSVDTLDRPQRRDDCSGCDLTHRDEGDVAEPADARADAFAVEPAADRGEPAERVGHRDRSRPRLGRRSAAPRPGGRASRAQDPRAPRGGRRAPRSSPARSSGPRPRPRPRRSPTTPGAGCPPPRRRRPRDSSSSSEPSSPCNRS